jgi:hypothetical protein
MGELTISISISGISRYYIIMYLTNKYMSMLKAPCYIFNSFSIAPMSIIFNTQKELISVG